MEASLGSAVVLGEGAVGVELDGQPLGEDLELVRTQLGGLLGQEGLGFLDLDGMDSVGQVADELLDDPQVFHIEEPCVPGLGGGRKHRGHRLPGQGGAGGELLGVSGAAAGFADGGAHDVSHDFVGNCPQGCLVGFLHRCGQIAGTCGGFPAGNLQPLQSLEQVRDRQNVPVQSAKGLKRDIQCGERV